MKAQDFLNYKNWAVAGDVLNSSKYAYKILNSLEGSGYKVVGINPRSSEETVYKNLTEAGNIEVLDLCINPKSGIELVKEAAELGIKYVLIQPGAESDEILSFCKNSDIIAIEGCALVELSRR
jgi:predicted CoA-binding protein